MTIQDKSRASQTTISVCLKCTLEAMKECLGLLYGRQAIEQSRNEEKVKILRQNDRF